LGCDLEFVLGNLERSVAHGKGGLDLVQGLGLFLDCKVMDVVITSSTVAISMLTADARQRMQGIGHNLN
jgi:hypothetical protein